MPRLLAFLATIFLLTVIAENAGRILAAPLFLAFGIGVLYASWRRAKRCRLRPMRPRQGKGRVIVRVHP